MSAAPGKSLPAPVIGDQFVLVSRASLAETKDTKTADPVPRTLSTILKNGMGGSKGKLKPLKVNIWQQYVQTSSTNTALTAPSTLDLKSFSEFVDFSVIYDQVKCESFEIHSSHSVIGNAGLFEFHYGVSYDPTDGTAHSAVLQPLQASQHLGPIHAEAVTATGNCVGPQDVTKTGMYVWRAKCPKGTQIQTDTGSSIVTGSWADVTNNSLICGYLKPFVAAQGAGAVSQLVHFVRASVIFRSRQ